ncbi:hypothetical protein Tco_0969237 [Tanacetum coccineum]
MITSGLSPDKGDHLIAWFSIRSHHWPIPIIIPDPSFQPITSFVLTILKENQNLRNELKELTSITEAWLNSSNKVNQCISEQIPTQKKKILGIDQLTEDTSSSRPKDLVFVKSSADNSKVSITGSNKPKLSEAEDSTLLNHDTSKVPSNESQRNTTDHSVVVSDSSSTDYDSADESSVCSTPIPSLEKPTGAEPISGPKTIKSILKLKSTFKAKTLKGITINEPSSAPARGNKSSSVSKTNLAPAGKLKNVKMKDDHPLAIVPPNALQNKYKTQFKMNYELCGQNNHLSENCYEVLFCKKCKRTNHRTCDHVEFMSSMNINQYHTGQGESSSRSRTARPAIPFPSCIHYGYNVHKSDDCVYYPVCEICGSYDHDTHAMFIPHLITMTFSGSGKEKLFKLRKLSLSKQCNIMESLSHLNNCRSKHILPAQIWDVPGPEEMYGNNSTYTTEGPDLNGKAVNKSQYRGMIGSLMNLTTSRLDIQFSTDLYIKNHTLKRDIEFHFIPTQYQLADIFTKPLDEPNFKRLIVELGGKTGGFDQITNKDAIILYSLPIINNDMPVSLEDIIIKLNKKHREKVVPYTRFLSLLIIHKMKEGYGDGELTLYPTQVFSVNNWALKPNQPKEPPLQTTCWLSALLIFQWSLKLLKTHPKRECFPSTKPGLNLTTLSFLNFFK